MKRVTQTPIQWYGVPDVDYDPDAEMCQDDYEFFTRTGQYSQTAKEAPTKELTLMTFGYLSSKSERIINELLALNVPLVDIRFNPDSRNWRYKQEMLRKRAGVLYHHIRELGNENYKEALSGNFSEPRIQIHNPDTGLARLTEILQDRGQAAIFCACSSPKNCHRTVVADLAKEKIPGLKIIHL